MTTITLDLPNDLAHRLQPVREQLPQILELGLRNWTVPHPVQFVGAAAVFEFLAGLPSPEEVIALRPAPILQERIRELLDKNHANGLTTTEEAEWQQIEYLEHLVRMAKAKAYQKLQAHKQL